MYFNLLRSRAIIRCQFAPLVVSTRRGHDECRLMPPNPFHDPYHDESINGRQPRSLVARNYTVTMATGVGVGPELMEIVQRVLFVANAPVKFEVLDMGAKSTEVDMENLIYSVERNGVCVKWNIEPQLEPTGLSRNMQLRRALDLYVNLIHIKSFSGLEEQARLREPVDVVIVRQNVEGEFAMLEHDNGKGVEHLKITTEYNCRRLAEFAFEYAVKNKRPRVRVVYNKGFLHDSEELFVNTVSKVSERYMGVVQFSKESMRQFASNMAHFRFNGDVLVTSVLYGGIIFNMLGGLMRTPGLFCGQNLSERYAVFEPAARTKGVKLTGQNKANPVAALLCGVHLLRHLQHHQSADIIQRAIDLTINEDRVHTTDLYGGTATTSEVVANIERRIREVMPEGYREHRQGPPRVRPTTPKPS